MITSIMIPLALVVMMIVTGNDVPCQYSIILSVTHFIISKVIAD